MKKRTAESITHPFRTATLLQLSRICSLLTVLALFGCKEQKPDAEAPGPKVEGTKITMPADALERSSISVEEVDICKTNVLHLTGRLVWNDDSTVRIFSPVAGRVETITADLGKSVGPGDTLAKIASPDFGQAQADARRAKGDLQLAERALARIRELNEHGAAPRKDVDSAEADYTRAISENDRAAARLALYGGTDGSYDQMYPLKAPLAGLVVEKNINPGQEVRPDQMLANAPQLFAPLFVITDPAKLWVQLDVPEAEGTPLELNQSIKIYSQSFPDKVFEGKVTNIGNSLDPNTRTVRVRGEVLNPDRLLKAEMFVTVDAITDLQASSKSGLVVSPTAIFLKDNQHYVFVESKPGQYERKAVRLGSENAGKVLVTDGLTAGQKVVTDGCLLLQALIDSGDRS
jgi:membrane fusion protein, heavy metal efflux system